MADLALLNSVDEFISNTENRLVVEPGHSIRTCLFLKGRKSQGFLDNRSEVAIMDVGHSGKISNSTCEHSISIRIRRYKDAVSGSKDSPENSANSFSDFAMLCRSSLQDEGTPSVQDKQGPAASRHGCIH